MYRIKEQIEEIRNRLNSLGVSDEYLENEIKRLEYLVSLKEQEIDRLVTLVSDFQKNETTLFPVRINYDR